MHLNACVGWVLSHPREMDAYIDGYREAALALFAWANGNNAASPDILVFPIAFLWRHHVELSLKDIIATGRRVEEQPWSFPGGHSLGKLWLVAKPYILTCGDPSDPVIGNVEANILEVEKIDPGADGFRYTSKFDKKANAPTVDRTLPTAPSHVNLRVLHEGMEALSNFFSGVRSALSQHLDYVMEARAHGC